MIQGSSEGLGVDFQISFAKSLEQKPQRPQIIYQHIGGGIEQRTGKRWVAKMPFFSLLNPHRRPNIRGKGRLVVRDEKPIEYVEIFTNGILVDVRIVDFFHVFC